MLLYLKHFSFSLPGNRGKGNSPHLNMHVESPLLTFLWLFIRAYLHVNTCTFMEMNICMQVAQISINACTFTYTHICIQMNLHTCTRILPSTRRYTHMYIHTHNMHPSPAIVRFPKKCSDLPITTLAKHGYKCSLALDFPTPYPLSRIFASLLLVRGIVPT